MANHSEGDGNNTIQQRPGTATLNDSAEMHVVDVGEVSVMLPRRTSFRHELDTLPRSTSRISERSESEDLSTPAELETAPTLSRVGSGDKKPAFLCAVSKISKSLKSKKSKNKEDPGSGDNGSDDQEEDGKMPRSRKFKKMAPGGLLRLYKMKVKGKGEKESCDSPIGSERGDSDGDQNPEPLSEKARLRKMMKQAFKSQKSGSFRRKPRVRGHHLKIPFNDVEHQLEVIEDREAVASLPECEKGPIQLDSVDVNMDVVNRVVESAEKYVGPKNVGGDDSGDDGEGQLAFMVSTLAGPYAQAFSFVALAHLDMIAVLIYHFFWDDSDFMCYVSTEDDGTRAGQSRDDTVAILSLLFMAHMARVLYKPWTTDPAGRLYGLRIFYATAQLGWGPVSGNCVDIFTNSAVGIALYMQWVNCGNMLLPAYSSWTALFVRRIHSHMHWVRSIFAFQRCFDMKRHLREKLQTAVSVNKRRFIDQEQGINLDLTYITDRLIAMAIPCVQDSWYRNDIKDVARFFAISHYGNFLVYNLCEKHEQGGNGNYDSSCLYGQVQKLPFHDHNAPVLRNLVTFCETACAWLDADDQNVVAVHCRGGKGRTGTFCAALLLWTGHCQSAGEALDRFALRRTARMRGSDKLQGVAAPSQIRYIHYLAAYVQTGIDIISPRRMLLDEIVLHNLKHSCMKRSALAVVIECGGRIQYDSGQAHGLISWETLQSWRFRFHTGNVLVQQDTSIRFFLFDETAEIPHVEDGNYSIRKRGVLGPGAASLKYGSLVGTKLMFVTFHTAFVDGIVRFPKDQTDGAYSCHESKFGSDFSIEVHVRDMMSLKNESPREFHGKDSINTDLMGTVNIENFLPKRIEPAQKFVQLQAKLSSLFERFGTAPTQYKLETDIMEGNAPEALTLHLITKGHVVSYEPRSKTNFVLDIALQLESLTRGSGQIVANYVPIMAEDHECNTSFKAKSAIVETKQISLPIGQCHGLPLHIDGWEQTDLAMLYEVVAFDVAMRARELRDRIIAAADRANSKREAAVNSTKDRLIQDVRKRFLLGPTENVLYANPSERVVEDGDTSGKASGTALIFSNFVVFAIKQSMYTDCTRNEVLIPLKDIADVSQEGSVVHLTPQTTLHEEDSARNSMCSTDNAGTPKMAGLSATGSFVTKRTSATGSLVSNSDPSITDAGAEWLKRGIDASGAFVQKTAQLTNRFKIGRTLASSSDLQNLAETAKANMVKRQAGHRRLVFEFPDNRAALEFTNTMSARLKRAKPLQLNSENETLDQSQVSHYLNTFMFGYVLPGEQDGDAQQFMQHLLNISEVKTYSPGETIISADSNEKRLFHMLSGQALRFTRSGHMEDIDAGEVIGEWRFLNPNGFVDGNTIVAASQVHVFTCSYDQVQSLCSLWPSFAVRFYRGCILCCTLHLQHFEKLQLSWEPDIAKKASPSQPSSTAPAPKAPGSPKISPRLKQVAQAVKFRGLARRTEESVPSPDWKFSGSFSSKLTSNI